MVLHKHNDRIKRWRIRDGKRMALYGDVFTTAEPEGKRPQLTTPCFPAAHRVRPVLRLHH